MQRPIPAPLFAAFHGAHYVVFDAHTRFTVHIGNYSPALASLMSRHNADTAAILTAYNPGAKPTSAEANIRAQRALLAAIQQLNLFHCYGENAAPDGAGHVEPTVVVLGVRREQALALAQQFRQLALVFSEANAIPELIWS